MGLGNGLRSAIGGDADDVRTLRLVAFGIGLSHNRMESSPLITRLLQPAVHGGPIAERQGECDRHAAYAHQFLGQQLNDWFVHEILPIGRAILVARDARRSTSRHPEVFASARPSASVNRLLWRVKPVIS